MKMAVATKPKPVVATPTVATTATTAVSKVNLNEMVEGDVFSEASHYIFTKFIPGNSNAEKKCLLKHVESGTNVELGVSYVQHLLTPADQFLKEVEVGKEDKYWTAKQIEEAVTKGELSNDVKLQPREGDIRVPGIRSIWAGIHGYDVLAVCYTKQDKAKPAKTLKAEREKIIADMTEAMGKAKTKEAATAIAQAELIKSFDTPLLDYVPGDQRILRGHKIQFESINGQYDVIDLDIKLGENQQRQVNVNTILWLVYHGVKYNVK